VSAVNPKEKRRAVSAVEQYAFDHRHNGVAGKGSAPRNCFSRQFRRNWDRIFRRTKQA